MKLPEPGASSVDIRGCGRLRRHATDGDAPADIAQIGLRETVTGEIGLSEVVESLLKVLGDDHFVHEGVQRGGRRSEERN